MSWTEKYAKGYRGRYKDARGRNRTAGAAKNKRGALALARAEEEKIRKGTWIDPDAGKMTFGDYFESQWLPSRVREVNTVATYRTHYRSSLKDAFGAVELRRLSSGMIQDWVKDLAEAGMKPGTIRAKYRTLSTVLGARRGRSAVRDRLIYDNPCVGVELPTVPPRNVAIYQRDELDGLIDHLDDWWKPLVVLAAETGMRWAELLGLEVKDVELVRRPRVWVRRTIVETDKDGTGNGTRFVTKPYPKSTRLRSMGIRPGVAATLQAMIAERGLTNSDRLFSMPELTQEGVRVRRTEAWPQGLPVSRSYFRDSVWRKAHNAAGIPQMRFHDLRASNISWLLAGGADLATVMSRAGHNDLTTTRRYVTTLDDADERALEALSRIEGALSQAARSQEMLEASRAPADSWFVSGDRGPSGAIGA